MYEQSAGILAILIWATFCRVIRRSFGFALISANYHRFNMFATGIGVLFVTITSLMEGSYVTITDISGNLVFKTQSLGGQALWYLKNMSGIRVRSGVYLVFITNEDGTRKQAAKILVIR
jgi:hypothetical protein